MESRIERIVLETEASRIVGDLSLPREGYRSRLSDFLNRGELEFVPLVNVEISSLDGGTRYERGFAVVARRHIQLAYPLTEVPGVEEEPEL